MSNTSRFALPLLSAGQAQKELSHNEALTIIDALVHGCVEAVGEETPPPDPEPGQCWITGTDPTGDWADRAEMIALWTGGGWRFIGPREGMQLWSRADDVLARYGDAQWNLGIIAANEVRIEGERVIGGRQSAIADPADGTVQDSEARVAIAAMLHTLRTHGLIATV